MSQWKNGIPIEVTPFAYAKVLLNLADLGSPYNIEDGLPGLRLRMGKMKAGPVVSDNGNFIIDAPFPETMMRDPAEVCPGASPSSEDYHVRTDALQLLRKIKMFTGVVEVGLFCNMAHAAYFGMEVSSRLPPHPVEAGLADASRTVRSRCTRRMGLPRRYRRSRMCHCSTSICLALGLKKYLLHSPECGGS